ncbi:hypothetical protein EDD17DRAFT_1037541 [Pisolithus thermaeus]|nr:hypothetical protein EDD17DRAFT_1037541 [Pisolithus thermaeus]
MAPQGTPNSFSPHTRLILHFPRHQHPRSRHSTPPPVFLLHIILSRSHFFFSPLFLGSASGAPIPVFSVPPRHSLLLTAHSLPFLIGDIFKKPPSDGCFLSSIRSVTLLIVHQLGWSLAGIPRNQNKEFQKKNICHDARGCWHRAKTYSMSCVREDAPKS